jgi:erythromycin esterase
MRIPTTVTAHRPVAEALGESMTQHTKWLLVLALASACQREGPAPVVAAHTSFTGNISSANGQAVSGPFLIGITDQKTGIRWGVAETDADGRFNIPLPTGEYALAITSPASFVYIENVRSPSTGFTVRLSSSCVPIEGQMRGALAPKGAVELSRSSQSIGDTFVAPVAADGGFRACVPDGEYSGKAGGSMISKSVRFFVPATRKFEVTAYARRDLESPPPTAAIDRSSLADLTEVLRERPRVIGLGEANHGTGDFYTQRGALALELARTGGLRYIMIEADAVLLLRIDDYAQGDPVDLSAALAAVGFWITDQKEFIAVIEELRALNASVRPERRVHVLGFDAQLTEPAAKLLVAGREELGLTKQQVDLVARLGPDNAKSFADMIAPDKATIQEVLARLERVERFDPRAASGRAAIAARSLRHQLGYLNEPSFTAQGGLRDAAMADLATFVVERGGPGRASLWAHAGHIARETYAGGLKSMGCYLATHFAADYYPIGFFTYEGSARAWDARRKIGVIPHQLAPTPPYYIESAIMQATRYPDAAWVAIKTMPTALQSWLARPRFDREFGNTYYDEEEAKTLRLFPSAFDALVVVKRGSSSTPTPTGERRAAH